MFVSVVSTRVPFKGTGKEYVAYDITEIQQAVKEAVEVREAPLVWLTPLS